MKNLSSAYTESNRDSLKKTNIAIIVVNTNKYNEIVSKKKSSVKIIPKVLL